MHKVKELNADVYNKWLGKASIEEFMKNLYVPYMLKHVKDSEEILLILEKKHLSKTWKEIILKNMPENLNFMDVGIFEQQVRNIIISKKGIGCSAKNILCLIRDRKYQFTAEVKDFINSCYACAEKHNKSYLPGLRKPLSVAEQERIWNAMVKDGVEFRSMNWVVKELGINLQKQQEAV